MPRSPLLAAAALTLPFLLAGCGLMGASGTQKPQFDLPKNKRILVFVDLHPAVTAPPGFAEHLGDSIVEELFKYRVLDKSVAQARLSELRHDTDKFRKLGIADIARATDADIVIYVDLITFNITALSDDSVTQGMAQTLVKVVDANGKRLWPPNVIGGKEVDVAVDPAFTETRDKAGVAAELNRKLARDVGRLFRSWARNENGMQNE